MSKHLIPWGKLVFQDETRITLPFSRELFIRRMGNETHLHLEKEGEDEVFRFITGQDASLYLEPGLPDLPMVIKPSISLAILPGKKLETLVEVPVIVKVMAGTEKKKDQLIEFPVKDLSRSFFGNPDSGEIAYFLESPLLNRVDEYEQIDSSVYCPMTISNRSDQNLDFDRMIFRVPYLSLYYGEKTLYSTPAVITFRGQDQISQVSFKKNPPQYEPDMKLASSPRISEEKGLLKRSFYFIKTLYNG